MALNTHIAQTAVDFQGLAVLRRSANADKTDQDTLRQVAGQFESLFVNMMLKSMRDASLGEGILDSSQSDMYQDMADQQLAMDLSSSGGLGLQDVIVRQMGGTPANKENQNGTDALTNAIDSIKVRPALSSVELQPLAKALVNEVDSASELTKEKADMSFDSPASFVEKLWSMAKKAGDKIGVAAEAILSQAALETGWGKHVIEHKSGESTHNLFNIKADSRWDGDKAAIGTVEYRNGVAVKEQAQFRSYDDYQQSFDDYVDFLQTQPRYQKALQHTDNPNEFIDELHKAGYATDPAYADKIKRIMNSETLAQISQQAAYS
ncbi:MAG: flagellar assembly peptidoglycan hydrolase FlgJ [Gammaproteobacteria bacterium]|nr:MAG: flagellar assembly peptidoglycan hydrolase FlgJ [Gammaproteobacteria bacterium]